MFSYYVIQYMCQTKIRGPMEDILVYEHALKHGLEERQFLHAWRNAVRAVVIERANGATDIVAIGFDQSAGRLR